MLSILFNTDYHVLIKAFIIRSQIARQSSLDGSSSSGLGVLTGIGTTRPSSSMTNLANISKGSDISLPTRPGSALGLLGNIISLIIKLVKTKKIINI